SSWSSPASSPHDSPGSPARNASTESRARNIMEQPEQNVATSTQLPKSQVQMPSGADTFDTPGAHIFDVDKVSCYYSSFRAVTDVSLKIYEHEITAFIGPSGWQNHRAADAEPHERPHTGRSRRG